MIVSVGQTESEWQKLVELAQNGEEIIFTKEGHAIARLTGMAPVTNVAFEERVAWLTELSELRESMATGKSGQTSDQILEDLRRDRNH